MHPHPAKMFDSGNQSMWHFETSHTSVEFIIKNLFFFTVRGRLNVVAGSILLDASELGRSAVKVTLNSKSIDTGNKRRDAHLRSAHFLATDSYPRIEFESVAVGPGRDRDTLAIKGSLTIKGKTKAIVLDVSEVDRSRSPQGEEVIYYCATAEIDRRDFGITYGRWLIGRTMKVTINVQASRQE